MTIMVNSLLTELACRAVRSAAICGISVLLCIGSATASMSTTSPSEPEPDARMARTIAWLKEWDITASQGMSRATESRRSAAAAFSRADWAARSPGSPDELRDAIVHILTWQRYRVDCTPQALVALQLCGKPQDADLVVSFFDSENYWNKVCAAETICVLWSEEATSATLHLAEFDDSDNVRSQACHTLLQLCKRVPDDALAETKPRLSDPHRAQVLEVLGRMSVNDRNKAVRSFLLDSLKHVDD
ncbi:MAG: hypothetical protein IT436_09595 [Phycisphaerales bacterium]|nr:hypothetical protein [Phycisphaerales bacterium]